MGFVLKRFVLLLLIILGIALTYIFTTFKFDSGKEVELIYGLLPYCEVSLVNNRDRIAVIYTVC
ncbi:hypothetical protein CBQ28_23480 [Pseudoalteromonas sp. GCY]|nr:hypothetical protein CBQ28_23480 [Pseudoalteromonas sp. GCY]